MKRSESGGGSGSGSGSARGGTWHAAAAATASTPSSLGEPLLSPAALGGMNGGSGAVVGAVGRRTSSNDLNMTSNSFNIPSNGNGIHDDGDDDVDMEDHSLPTTYMERRHSTSSSIYTSDEPTDSCLLTTISIIVNSFSLRATYRQLCAKDRRPLAPLHCLRVLATLWIIVGNVVVYMMPVIRNLAAVEDTVTHSWAAQVVIGAVLANDCFLVLGGFFAGHSFIVRLKKVNRKSAFSSISNLRYGCIDVPRMYASRLVRILPTYGLVLACLITISGKLNPGPLHSVFQKNAVEPCKSTLPVGRDCGCGGSEHPFQSISRRRRRLDGSLARRPVCL